MPEEVVFNQWMLGWNPENLPTSYVYPNSILEGQVMDSSGVRFMRNGQMRWRRNQFSIDAPGAANVHDVKSILEYTTSDYEQLLAFVKYGAGAPYSGKMYYQNVDWSAATPAQTTYGYEVFNGGTWTDATTEAAAVALLSSSGISAAFQRQDDLFIAVARDSEIIRWNGSTLKIVGIVAPQEAPTGSVGTGGDLVAGTYSYYYTYYDGEFESMPSPILDVTVSADGAKITLNNVTDDGLDYRKRIYRAYTESTADGARGATFNFLVELPEGDSTAAAEDLTTWTEVDTGDNRLAVTSAKVTATAMQEDEACYVYKDLTSVEQEVIDYRFGFYVTSLADGGSVDLFAVSDAVGVDADWTNAVKVRLWRDGSVYYVGDEDTDNRVVVEPATNYYCRLHYRYEPPTTRTEYLTTVSGGGSSFARRRRGVTSPRTTASTTTIPGYGVLELEVYEVSDRSGLPRTCALTQDTSTLRYVYAIAAKGGAGTEAFSGYVENVYLGGVISYVDNLTAANLGPPMEFDHAKPPTGNLLCWHKERAFMAGSNTGSPSYEGYDTGYWRNVLFCSELDEPAYWPGDNMFVVGDDTPIVGLASWGDHLLCFKENSVWSLTGYDSDDFMLSQLTEAVGAVPANTQCAAPPGVLWLASDGYYFWNGAEIERIIAVDELTPWSLPSDDDVCPRIAYHENRFYIMQDSGWLEWTPTTKQWTYHVADFTDADTEIKVGMRSYARGTDQTHIITSMAWASGQGQLLTVLDQAGPWTHQDDAGSSYSDYFSPVAITIMVPPPPPGYEIIPLEVWVDGSWTLHATESKRPKLYLNNDADYSSTAGQNVWETTPDCPQGGDVIGIPNGYSYVSGPTTYYKTNASRQWYIQIKGESAVDFVLTAVGLKYWTRRAAG